MSGEWTHLMVL